MSFFWFEPVRILLQLGQKEPLAFAVFLLFGTLEFVRFYFYFWRGDRI